MSRSLRSRAASSSATSSCSVTGSRLVWGSTARTAIAAGALVGTVGHQVGSPREGTVRRRKRSGGRTLRRATAVGIARTRGAVARRWGPTKNIGRMSGSSTGSRAIRATPRSGQATGSAPPTSCSSGAASTPGPTAVSRGSIPCWSAIAVDTKPWNNGCGRSGRDLNSGWNWRGHEPRVVLELDDLHQPAVGREPGQQHPGRLEGLAVVVVDLEAMAVALVDHLVAVHRAGLRAGLELRGVQAEAHRPALVLHLPLVGHEVDHRVLREHVELGRVDVLRPDDLAREVDHRALQPEAQPEVRHPDGRAPSGRRGPCPRSRGGRTRRARGRRPRPRAARRRSPA